MFKKPDEQTARLLELAAFLDNLDPSRFSMTTWGQWEEPRCICGWFQQINGHVDKADGRQAAESMGIDYEYACKLFGDREMTPKGAAKALRELAVTR